MGLVVLPALIPDIERVYDIYFNAFLNDEMGRLMVNLLFPDGIEGEFRKQHTAATLAYWHTAQQQYTMKCVDTETGEIVGMALGDGFFRERTEEELQYPGVPWLQGEARDKADAVLKPLHDAKNKIWGNKRLICEFFHCSTLFAI